MPPPEPTSYDRVPYPSTPFPQTHPDRLATVAALYGMRPPPPAVPTARVLEVGCAHADNLIPLALQHPDARLVGIDASAAQIATATATARALGVANLELLHMDVQEVPATIGSFDYVICHGVYSWVTDEVRHAILALIRRHLRPNGVAYVSYNTYPGWRLLQCVRDILVYDTRTIDDPAAKVARARATVELLLRAVPEDQALHGIVKSVARTIGSPHADAYVFHEYFESTNEPVYFHEFAARAAGHGLKFLSEANVEHMQTSRLTPAAQGALGELEGQPIEHQQYLDFLCCRPFRQTLLCHDAVTLERQLRPERLEALHFASTCAPTDAAADPSTRERLSFRTRGGAEFQTDHPMTKASLLHLFAAWPRAVARADLEIAARARIVSTPITVDDPVAFASDRDEWLRNLLTLVAAGVIEAHTAPARPAAEVSARPTASPWARWRAARGGRLTNLWHQTVETDAVQRRLLTLLDGTRAHAEVLDELVAFLDSERLVVTYEGRKLDDRDEIRRTIAEIGLPRELRTLARAALLIA